MRPDLFFDTECTPVRLVSYEILSQLSRSAVLNVYLARRTACSSDGELVVIKRVPPKMFLAGHFSEAFVSAARDALVLDHPNIVRTENMAADATDHHVVEEFLDGKSLRRLWGNGTGPAIPRDLLVWILTQVLSGLHYAHELIQRTTDGSRSFVHQWVNPSSVFVTYGGGVKLANFGLGATFGAALAASGRGVERQLAYAAPEQCLGAPLDRRSDVFAVGVMLWEAITGRRRWNGQSDAEMFLERVQGDEPSISSLAPGAPRELVSICEQALAYDPEQRFPSALEFSQALEGYLQTEGWSGGAQQLCLLLRGRLEVARGPSTQESCGMASQVQLNQWPSAERVSIPTGLTHTLPAPAGAVEAKRRLMATLFGLLPLAARSRLLALAALIAGAALVPIAVGQIEPSSGATVSVAPEHHDSWPSSNASNVAASSITASDRFALSINVSPSNALIQLDGSPISNPYFELHELDRGPHHLSISLAGHEAFEREVPFDANVDWTILLSPLKAEEDQRFPRD